MSQRPNSVHLEGRRLWMMTCLAIVLTATALVAQEPVTRPLERTRRAVAETTAIEDETTPEHPLRPAIRMASESLARLESVTDYEAILTKRERIQGELRREVMRIKFREEPFSVYMIFGGENEGREVLYVDGQNQNNILAHEGSGLKALVGTVSLSTTSPEVLENSRHPITEVGLRNLLTLMIERWEEQSDYGETEVKYYHNARLGETECVVIECTHPRPRRQFRYHLTRLYFDKETQLPVRVENYGFPARPGTDPPLEEEYTYTDLQTNVGLTDVDFDRNNPAYAF